MSVVLPILRGFRIKEDSTPEDVSVEVVSLEKATWGDIMGSQVFNLLLLFAAPILFLGALVSLISTPFLYLFYRAFGWWDSGTKES